jgi:hypothetical protein
MTSITQHAVETGTATMQTKLSYIASGSGVVVAGLTITEVVGITVGVFSIFFGALTYWSNHKKNKAIIASLDKQEEQRQVGEAQG